MTTYQKRFWIIALVMVIAVSAAIATYISAGRAGSARAGGFCAQMDDSLGLYVGNPVTQMGYKVGEITSIDAGDTAVKVSFDLTSNRKFPGDVQAVTRSKSVLADRSLELVGNYDGGPVLEPETCIDIGNTHTPESISEIAGSTADLIAAVAPPDGDRTVKGSIDGLARALDGTGPQIAELLKVASAAAQDPNAIIADIGSIITNMAPLSVDVLAQWNVVEEIIRAMPESADVGAEVLWPGTQDMPPGMTPIALALNDIQSNYGDEIWAAADEFAGALHIAASRVGDVREATEVLPAVAEKVALVSSPKHGVGLTVAQPTIAVDAGDNALFCKALNAVRKGACTVSGQGAELVEVGLFDLVLSGVVR